ncbi:hypothetical protein GOODEAATRI_015037, partial [Goodea atripinnis]
PTSWPAWKGTACWLARTDPKDVARVESKTVIVTKNQRDTIPIPAGGVKSQLGSWMSRTMYVIPFSMGPVGSTLSKYGVQILGITNPQGVKRYVAAAFPSACGKTNLAMMKPAIPGWKVECVGDDIAWMKFDSQASRTSVGKLRAINPENGFFGVAPGTSDKTNPYAMATISKNTVFTNVGETSDGGVWWEGLDPPAAGVTLTDWHGKTWKPGKVIMHDPFAMRPFFGYNFGDYLAHWLSMQTRKAPTQLPKIFHVNWFRKDPATGAFLWPGFGENARVLEWIFKRCSREREDEAAKRSYIGWLPEDGAIDTKGLGSKVDMGALFDVPKQFWQKETKELRAYFTQQVGADLPTQVEAELKALEDRVHS